MSFLNLILWCDIHHISVYVVNHFSNNFSAKKQGREICHCGLWKDLSGWQTHFIAVKKPKKLLCLLSCLYLKDGAFAKFERDITLQASRWKGYHLSVKNERGSFSVKNWYGWTSGWSLPLLFIVYPPGNLYLYIAVELQRAILLETLLTFSALLRW